MNQQTQAARLVAYIRSYGADGEWPTYQQVLDSHISVCPWKRLAESGDKYLRAGERLVRGTDPLGRTTFQIVRGS